jgi:predicted transcriptional regulator
MTAKQKILGILRNLPANASIEDAIERLLFLAKIEKGLQQADSGRTLSHGKAKEKMARWFK